jgi:hypothetical protein
MGETDALTLALHEAQARIAELERELARSEKMFTLKSAATDRWVPCPDHRDKVESGVCQPCRAERAERDLAAARERIAELEVEVAEEDEDPQTYLEQDNARLRAAFVSLGYGPDPFARPDSTAPEVAVESEEIE